MKLSIPKDSDLVIYPQDTDTVRLLYEKVYGNKAGIRKPTLETFTELVQMSDIVFSAFGVLFRMTHTDKTFPYVHALIYSHTALGHRKEIRGLLRAILFTNGYTGLQAIIPEDKPNLGALMESIGFTKLDIILGYFLYGQSVLNGVRYILD